MSKPIFASNHALSGMIQALHYLRTFAPLQTNLLTNMLQIEKQISEFGGSLAQHIINLQNLPGVAKF